VATTGLLWHALGICPGEVVVFTGGPARTSLALRVARELTEAGRPPVLNEVGGCVVLVEAGGGPARLSAGLDSGRPTVSPPAELVVPVLDGPVTPAAAEALLSWKGLLGNAPGGARVVPALVPAGPDDAGIAAREAASLLVGREVANAQVGRVVLAEPEGPNPVRAVVGDVAAIVLAGGASRRFGGSKLLHAWDVRTVLEASLQAPLKAGLREVLVVTGAYHEALAPLLSRYPVRVIPNPDWAEGMSTSLRAGLRALVGEPEAVVVCLGDMPFLPPAVVTELVRAYRRTGAPIVAPEVGGVRRSPVLFDRALLPELMAIRGDEGGRAVVQRHQAEMVLVPFPEERWFRDVDEPGDLRE
jgi:Uncharacterized protein family UPF0007.